MTLSAFQLSYNGLTFGASQDVQLVSVAGLREAPPVRTNDLSKPRQHGAFVGKAWFDERVVQLTLSVSNTVAAFETVLAGVATAFANVNDPANQHQLQFMLPSWATPRQVTGRVTKGGFPVDVNYAFHKVDALPVEITCGDPLIYDTATQSISQGLPTVSGGVTFPLTFPFSFGTTSSSSFTLTNAGTEAMAPVFTFTGPMIWPTLLFGSSYLTFEVVLGASDTLVVDCGASTATLNGTAARFDTLASGSVFPTVPPGGQTFQFTSADSTTASGTVACTLPTGAWGWV